MIMKIKALISFAALLGAFALMVASLVAQEGLYTDAWGFDYEEARWDYVTDGKFNSRVFVGKYEGDGPYYLGMMRNSTDRIVKALSVSVEYADGRIEVLPAGECYLDGCLNQYDDQFGAPGSYLQIIIRPNNLDQTFAALKSAKYVLFNYQTQSSLQNNRFKTNTLSLKGSRKAIDALQKAYAPIAAPSAQGGDALAYLENVMNNRWAFPNGSAGKQRFKRTDTPCTFHVFIDHPNSGKTTFEMAFQTLDSSKITQIRDFFNDEKFPILEIETLGNREIVKQWIDYPDGTSEFERVDHANLYFPLDIDFDRMKRALVTSIDQCVRDHG